MSLLEKLSHSGHKDHKTILLYRFHILAIGVNLLAASIDFSSGRTTNAAIEVTVVAMLLINIWFLREYCQIKTAAYLFLLIMAGGLFGIIHMNHFATMSVLFVLLLPLTTMLFVTPKGTFLVEIVMSILMVLLLYLEYLNNPSNPLIQNPKALFNLGYTAIIIYLFGLLYHFYIRKTMSELENANRQQEMLLGEVHHRVKNNLNIVASIIGLQTKRAGTSEKEELLKTKVRIESIAMVHEMLYACEDFEKINFLDYTNRLSSLIMGMYGEKEKVAVTINSGDILLPLETMIHLGIITNELLTNSIKYAFGGRKGEICITLQRKHNVLHYDYHDNGRGVADTRELLKKKSLGIKLIHLSVKQLKGEVAVHSNGGLQYAIRIKNG